MKRRVTSRQVAERAGVSRTTVSFVLNDVPDMRIPLETRERVQRAAEELGYHPNASARRLVTGQTNLIAYVERQAPDHIFTDGFWPEVLRGAHDAALSQDYEVLYAPDAIVEGMGRCARLLLGNHVDGAIISGPREGDRELVRLIELGAPLVIQGSWPDRSIPAVDVDNAFAAKKAVRYLVDLGHTKIGLMLHAPAEYIASRDRRIGFEEALAEAGVAREPDWIVQANFTPESGEAAMEQLLTGEDRPTAVFATSDTIAIGGMMAARRAGLKIPDDIAFIGFDDIPMARYQEPPLSTVRLPAYDLGRESGKLMTEILSGRMPDSAHRTLQSELVIRQSCGGRGE